MLVAPAIKILPFIGRQALRESRAARIVAIGGRSRPDGRDDLGARRVEARETPRTSASGRCASTSSRARSAALAAAHLIVRAQNARVVGASRRHAALERRLERGESALIAKQTFCRHFTRNKSRPLTRRIVVKQQQQKTH